MINYIKKYYTIVLLDIVYTTVAIIVYIVWLESAFHLWYVNVIVALAIFALGFVIGYLYIKAKIDKEKKEEIPDESSKENS